MYFDYDYWWRVVRHVWGLREWRGRNRMLVRLLLVVPLLSLFHGICFMLDYLLFWRLWTQRVEQPVFIVGHGRSGTTLMHRLMSADGDRFSYFLYWEMFFPSLLQKKIIRILGAMDTFLLKGYVESKLKAWDDKTFGPYRHMHYMSLWSAEEDCFAMAAAFVTQQWSVDIPMMDVVDFFHLDQMPAKRRRWMGHYRELVKRQLLLYGGDKTHLAKNPLMCGWVDSIIEEFPDARIVVMMRNPAECIPSCLKLLESAWSARGWTKVQYETSLNILAELSFESFDNPRNVLAANPQTPQCVVDYRDLTNAPRETIHTVYKALGMTVTDEFDQWLLAQAEREKKHNSKFEYSLGEYHLSREEIRERLADFYQIYQWDIEPADQQSMGETSS